MLLALIEVNTTGLQLDCSKLEKTIIIGQNLNYSALHTQLLNTITCIPKLNFDNTPINSYRHISLNLYTIKRLDIIIAPF